MLLTILFFVLFVSAIVFYFKETNKLKSEILRKDTQIINLKFEHSVEISKARKDAVDRSKAVTRGHVTEQLVPIIEGFPYNLSDVMFMGNPFDFVIFDGMSQFRDGDKEKEIQIIFADVKFNTSKRTPVQNAIKRGIESKNIKYEDWTVSKDNKLEIK